MYVNRQLHYLNAKAALFTILGILLSLAFLFSIITYLGTIIGIGWSMTLALMFGIAYAAYNIFAASLSDKKFFKYLHAHQGFYGRYFHMEKVNSEVQAEMGLDTAPAWLAFRSSKKLGTTVGIIGIGRRSRLVVGERLMDESRFINNHLPVLIAHEAGHLLYKDNSSRLIGFILMATSNFMALITIWASIFAFGWRTGLVVFGVQFVWRSMFGFLFSQSIKSQEKRCDLIAASLFSPQSLHDALAAYVNHPAMVNKHKDIYGHKVIQFFFGGHPYIVNRLKYITEWSNHFEGRNFLPPSMKVEPEPVTATETEFDFEYFINSPDDIITTVLGSKAQRSGHFGDILTDSPQSNTRTRR